MRSSFPSLLQWVCVATGGALGAVLRYSFQIMWPASSTPSFPLTTFTVNVIGCFLAGVFLSVLEKANLRDSHLYLLLLTGFCGGFTTFSAFSMENFAFLQQGAYGIFLIYSVGSLFLGVIAVALGWYLAR